MDPGPASAPPTPAERVLEAVSGHADVEIGELPPLYGTVDPEALDTFVRSLDRGVVHFEYAGCHVTVRDDGAVAVTDEPIGRVEPVKSDAGDRDID